MDIAGTHAIFLAEAFSIWVDGKVSEVDEGLPTTSGAICMPWRPTIGLYASGAICAKSDNPAG
jgi:hypothetical protein